MEPHNSFMSSHKDQIVLSKRQVSMIMASMVIFCLFIFLVGFFLGKRTVIDELSSNVTQNALHDQIDYLLTTQSLQSSQEDTFTDQVSQEQPVIEIENIDTVTAQPTPVVLPEYVTLPAHNQTSKLVEEKNIEEISTANIAVKDSQYACLIGFGTKKAANAFVARLKKHNVPVVLKTVISKTSAGAPRTWYQAVTQTYDSSAQLQAIVNKVKRLEHIRDNDIKIVHIK